MILRLEQDGRILEEINDKQIEGEISIGRSNACTWTVPSNDKQASGKHAIIERKGKRLVLRDLDSTNGTFHKGKRVQKVTLSVGDQVTVGSCIVTVEKDRVAGGIRPSTLTLLNSKLKGQKRTLDKENLTVGSDPDSGLFLMDMLISRKHAEIQVKPDKSCWAMDLGSRNGTTVNGVPLQKDKERLLKDGDIVSFAQVEASFQDGSIPRVNSQVWLRLGVMVATLLIALGVYQGIRRMKPGAEAHIRSARKFAQTEAFTEARAELDKAVLARNAKANELSILDLRRMLDLWRSTASSWSSSKAALKKSDWTTAARNLGRLVAAKKEAWGWNEEAISTKQSVSLAKDNLDALLKAKSALNRDDTPVEDLRTALNTLSGTLTRFPASPPDYLEPMQAELTTAKVELDLRLQNSGRLDDALNRLREAAPPYPTILETLAHLRKSAKGAIRHRAALVEGPVKALHEASLQLRQMAALAYDLKFSEALKLEVTLPSADACGVDHRLQQNRTTQDNQHKNITRDISQMEYLYLELLKRVPHPERAPQAVTEWKNTAAMAPVFACGITEQAMPRRSRKQALDAYDRFLGVEHFYEFIGTFPEPIDPAMLEELPFPPLLLTAKQTFKATDSILNYVAEGKHGWLNYGKVKTLLGQLQRISDQRAVIVQNMAKQAAARSGREALIAGAIAAYLCDDAGAIQVGSEPLEKWLPKAHKALKNKLITLNSEYTTALPTRQLQIRDEILKQGLPGDGVVRRMWASRDASRNR